MTRSVRPKVAPKPEVQVGDIVRRLRKARHFSVRMLADKCGFSPSFISQVELRQASPSIASTERIASALGVTLGQFFRTADPILPAIIRSDARPVVQSQWSRARIETLGPLNTDSGFEPIVITIQPSGASGHKPYAREAEQLAMILQGSLELTLEEDIRILTRGDAVIVGRMPAGNRLRCCSSPHTGPTSPRNCHSHRNAIR